MSYAAAFVGAFARFGGAPRFPGSPWVPALWSRMAEADAALLLEQAQGGDRVAFGRLVRLNQRRVYACALQMLGDAGEAEDAVQEAFLRAWRAIARFDGRSELSTWLYRITVNVCLNTIRKRRRVQGADLNDPRVPEPKADPTQGGTDPGLTAESSQLYRRLARALDGLSPSLRTTVILVLIQGLPHKSAAEILGCPEGTVAWRIHEARRRLREALSEEAANNNDSGDAAATPAGRST